MIEEDHCMYLKWSKRSILILSLYIDDILLVGNDMDSIVTTKKWLSFTFEMKDMGGANIVLGVKITRDRSKTLLSLSPGTYIKKILERFHMHNSKPIDTPMEKGYTQREGIDHEDTFTPVVRFASVSLKVLIPINWLINPRIFM